MAAATGMRRRGFSLVELLVVVAIVALLAALVLPVMANARMMAYRTVCLNNLRETALVFQSYALDFQGRLPLANDTNPRLIRPDMHAAIEGYFPGPYDIFYCPSPHATVGPEWWKIRRLWDADHYQIGYVYVANLDSPGCPKFVHGDPVTSIMDPLASRCPVLFDVVVKSRAGAQVWEEFPHDGVNHGVGMNELFGDMHAEWVPMSRLKVEYHYIYPGDLWW